MPARPHHRQIWGCTPRKPRRRCPAATVRTVSRASPYHARPIHDPICSGSPSPSRSRRPAPFMGCAASSDKAERRRRGRALGHSEASTTGLLSVGQDQDPVATAAWRRRGCKVAPEPKEQEDPAMPGSPSFRYYCQKAAAVDALVAEDEAGYGDGWSIKITETSQAPETNELTVEDTSNNKIVEVHKPKEVTKWLRFRGLAIVAAAWYNLFSRHRSKASTPPSSAAAKSHPPGPAPAARSHT